jgi:hypothetical protein
MPLNGLALPVSALEIFCRTEAESVRFEFVTIAEQRELQYNFGLLF